MKVAETEAVTKELEAVLHKKNAELEAGMESHKAEMEKQWVSARNAMEESKKALQRLEAEKQMLQTRVLGLEERERSRCGVIEVALSTFMCPLCHLDYNEFGRQPCVLGCGHMICAECLQAGSECAYPCAPPPSSAVVAGADGAAAAAAMYAVRRPVVVNHRTADR